jgi:hypothetical protein
MSSEEPPKPEEDAPEEETAAAAGGDEGETAKEEESSAHFEPVVRCAFSCFFPGKLYSFRGRKEDCSLHYSPQCAHFLAHLLTFYV